MSRHKYIVCIEDNIISERSIIEIGERYYTYSGPFEISHSSYYVFDIESNMCLGSFHKKYFMDLDEFRNDKINEILQ